MAVLLFSDFRFTGRWTSEQRSAAYLQFIRLFSLAADNALIALTVRRVSRVVEQVARGAAGSGRRVQLGHLRVEAPQLLQPVRLLRRHGPRVQRVVQQHLEDGEQRLLVRAQHVQRLLAAPANTQPHLHVTPSKRYVLSNLVSHSPRAPTPAPPEDALDAGDAHPVDDVARQAERNRLRGRQNPTLLERNA